MADRVASLLRFAGFLTLLTGISIALLAATTSPPLYPPIETSYVLIGALLSLAGLVALISRYRGD